MQYLSILLPSVLLSDRDLGDLSQMADLRDFQSYIVPENLKRPFRSSTRSSGQNPGSDPGERIRLTRAWTGHGVSTNLTFQTPKPEQGKQRRSDKDGNEQGLVALQKRRGDWASSPRGYFATQHTLLGLDHHTSHISLPASIMAGVFPNVIPRCMIGFSVIEEITLDSVLVNSF